MALTKIQSKHVNTGAATATSLTATLDSAPTPGNFLIAYTNSSTSGGVGPFITQGGVCWNRNTRHSSNATGGELVHFWLGLIRNNSDSAVLFTPASAQACTLQVIEFTGFANPCWDVATFGNASGSSTTPGATVQQGFSERSLLLVGGTIRGIFATQGLNHFSAPTNGYTLDGQTNTNINTANSDRSSFLLYQEVNSAGSLQGLVTSSTNNQWAGLAVRIADGVPTFTGGVTGF